MKRDPEFVVWDSVDESACSSAASVDLSEVIAASSCLTVESLSMRSTASASFAARHGTGIFFVDCPLRDARGLRSLEQFGLPGHCSK